MSKIKFWYHHFKFIILQRCLYYSTVFKYAIDNIDHMEDSISKRILSLDFIQKIINRSYLKLVKKTIVADHVEDSTSDSKCISKRVLKLKFIQKIIKKLYLKSIK